VIIILDNIVKIIQKNIMAPPRFKKSPRPSKLRLRMKANKQTRQANRLARRSTDRKVVESLEDSSITKPGNIDVKSAEESFNNQAMQKMVDRAYNGNSLKDNIDISTPRKSYKEYESDWGGHKLMTSDDTIKPQLKVEEDLKLDTSKGGIPKLEHSVEAHNTAKRNISAAYKKHNKDFNPKIVQWNTNEMGEGTKRIIDASGNPQIIRTSLQPDGTLVDSDPINFKTYMTNPDNKGALDDYSTARQKKVNKVFYDSDDYKIWNERTKGTGMKYRAGGGDESFEYTSDYQKPLTKRTKDIR